MPALTPTSAFDAINVKIVAAGIINRLNGNRIIKSLMKNDLDFVDQAAYSYTQGQTVTLTKEAQFTGETITLGTDATFETPTINSVDVKLEYITNVGSAVYDFDRAVSNDRQLDNYAQGQATTITRLLEAQAIDLLVNDSGVGAGQEIGTPGTALNFDTLTAIQEKMMDAGVAQGTPITLCVTPAAYRELLKDDDVRAATNRGDNITSSGMILETLGMSIVPSIYLPSNTSSDSVSGSTGKVMFAMTDDTAVVVNRPLPDDAAGVEQLTVVEPNTGWTMRYTRGYDMLKKRQLVSWDVLWGVKVYRPETMVLVRGGI